MIDNVIVLRLRLGPPGSNVGRVAVAHNNMQLFCKQEEIIGSE